MWPRERCDDEVAAALRGAFVLGPDRTPEQDMEFGLIEVSDIAVRALSPGTNDPTTAMRCIDRLAQVLAELATRGEPDPRRADGSGRVRLVARGTSFERAMGLAFDQIRHFGADNPGIAKKLLEALLDLAAVVPASGRPAVAGQAEGVLRAARRAIADPVDLAATERLGRQVLDRAGAPPT